MSRFVLSIVQRPQRWPAYNRTGAFCFRASDTRSHNANDPNRSMGSTVRASHIVAITAKLIQSTRAICRSACWWRCYLIFYLRIWIMAAIRMHIYWQSRLVESEGLFAERKLERERERERHPDLWVPDSCLVCWPPNVILLSGKFGGDARFANSASKLADRLLRSHYRLINIESRSWGSPPMVVGEHLNRLLKPFEDYLRVQTIFYCLRLFSTLTVSSWSASAMNSDCRSAMIVNRNKITRGKFGF